MHCQTNYSAQYKFALQRKIQRELFRMEDARTFLEIFKSANWNELKTILVPQGTQEQTLLQGFSILERIYDTRDNGWNDPVRPYKIEGR